MATQTVVSPKKLFCSEKWRLLDEYVAAARDIMNIQSLREAAIASGREDTLGEFDPQLQAARTRKDEALDTYIQHIQGHGC